MTAEAVARAAVQIARPLGKDPLAEPITDAAGRRLARRHLRPARSADRRDHDPTLRRAGLHRRRADAKRRVLMDAWGEFVVVEK